MKMTTFGQYSTIPVEFQLLTGFPAGLAEVSDYKALAPLYVTPFIDLCFRS